MPRKRLGELLIEQGVIDEDQLASALTYQRQWGHRIGASLLAKGFISEAQLCEILQNELRVPAVDLSEVAVDRKAVKMLNFRFCENHEIFPFGYEEAKGRPRLRCAMADPQNIAAIDEIEFTTGCHVVPVLAPVSQINAAIRRYYYGERLEINKILHEDGKPPVGASVGEMVLVRPGGREEMVDTRIDNTGSVAPPVLSPSDLGATPQRQDSAPTMSPRPDNLVRASAIPRQITARTHLAQLVEAKAEKELDQMGGSSAAKNDLDFLYGVNSQDQERLDKLERMFWGLVRIMAKKGQITKEEFLEAIDDL